MVTRFWKTNKKITVDEAEAFEVDILALNPKGEKYCVEVKVGSAAVSDVHRPLGNRKATARKPRNEET